MKENSEIEVQVDIPLSELEKQDIVKKLKIQYGEQTNVTVKNKKIKSDAFEQKRSEIANNNLKDVYIEYLADTYPDIDLESFFKLDDKINNLLPEQNEDLKRFKIKWFGGKNILSFNEFQVDLENRGIVRIYSEPENMGGKSNLIRCLKILLFGEFYRSNMERSTLSTIMNKYSPLNFAYLEGEIEIENKTYFVRRDFTKNAQGKTSQKITVGCDGQIIDTDQFEKMVGKIKDFLFISFFDSFSIEKWLNTKPTERYRMFLNYFGLGNIEEKAKICKKEYDVFLKSSESKKYFHLDIDEEINNLKNKIYNLTSENAKLKADLSQIDIEVLSLETIVTRLQNQFKGVPDSLLNESEESLNKKIEIVNNTIKNNENEIVLLTQSIINLTESKEELSQQLLNLQDQISKVDADKNLLLDLENLNYLYSNFVVESKFLQNKEETNKKIEDLRNQYMSLKSLSKIKEETLTNMPDSQVCDNCGVKTDNSEKKKSLRDEIDTINIQLASITESGNTLKADVLKIDNQIKESEIEYKKNIKKLIDQKTIEIEENKKQKISNIRSLLLEVQNKLFQYAENEKKYSKIEIIKKQNSLEEINLNQLRDKLSVVNNYANELLHNEQLTLQIQENKKIRDEKNTVKSNLLVDIKFNEKQIEECEKQISNFEKVSENISTEIKVDKLYKTYLDVHSKGGLAMKILNDLAQDINQDLAAILSDEDFSPSIKIEDDAIEFYFYRDNEQFNMAEGSGYEKTILLLSLHYLLLSKMTIPISNIFILDEVFVGVAKPFLHRAYKVVESMLNMFDTILLITHVEDIGEWCTDSIKVTKNNNISKILQ